MPLPDAAPLIDVALLLLRVLIGILFVTSGWSHASDPVARSEGLVLPGGLVLLP